jgi:predicted Zn finger-like uncharacterized protein
MKFQCDRCKTRYSIADEKVRGKILKIRCKTCATIVTVKDPTVVTGEAQALSASGSFGAIAQPGSYGAVPSATGSLPFVPAPPPPRPGAKDAAPAEAEPTKISPPPDGADADDAAPPDEWFLSVDGKQQGPFTPAQAQARVARRAPDEEMFAWREDFSEWLPVEEVPLLAVHLPKAPPRMFADADHDDERDDARPVDAHDGMDFHISDASRIVRMPLLAPSGPSKRDGLPATHGLANGTAPRAAVAEAAAVAEPPPAPEPTPTPAPSPRQSLQIPIASLSMEMAAQPPPRATSELSAAAHPHRRHRRSFYVVTIGGAAVVAGILVGAITLVGRASDAPRAAVDPVPTVVTDFYAKDSLVTPAAPTPVPTAPASDKAGRASGNGPKGAPAGRRADVATGPAAPAAPRAEAARSGPASAGKVDTFADEGPRAGPLTPDDVRETYLANEVMLKRCYERALKQESNLPVSKMDVKITIDATGSVSRIALPQETGLGTCVATAIRNWRFRKSTGDFTTEFTVVFAKRG